MKTCPDCAESVQEAARVCRFCGFRFEGASAVAAAPSPPDGECPRCASHVSADDATCETCGLVLDPEGASLSIAEVNDAAACQRAWKADPSNAEAAKRFAEEHPQWMAKWPGVDRAKPPNGSALGGTDSATSSRNGIGSVLAVAAILVGILWFSGTLDKPLSNIGLNKDPCVQNAFGATFCGEDAKRLCREFGGPACSDLGMSEEGELQRELERDLEALEAP